MIALQGRFWVQWLLQLEHEGLELKGVFLQNADFEKSFERNVKSIEDHSGKIEGNNPIRHIYDFRDP